MLEECRILIVDDEELNCISMEKLLNQYGFPNITTTTSPFKALGLLGLDHNANNGEIIICSNEESFDLILLDVMMPGLNGFEVCKIIKQKSNIPVILITALDGTEDHVKGIEAGADDIQVKPAVTQKLIARINILLKKKRSEDSLNADYETLKNIQKSLPSYCRKNQDNIGKYKVIELIGSGTSSTVYKVSDPDSDKTYAIKILNEEIVRNPDNIASFRREIEIISKLRHPGLIKVHDFGSFDGYPYVVMDLVDGLTLQKAIQLDGRPLFEQARNYSIQIAEVIDYIHSHSIVHRDIKLENLILDKKTNQVKLGDFGLSFNTEFDQEQTQTAGTPLYMAPETFTTNTTSLKSDNYAYGIVLFTLFSGKPPFRGGSLSDIIHMHCTAPVPNLRSFNPKLKEGWYKLATTCLDKNPNKRPESILEFTEGFDPEEY